VIDQDDEEAGKNALQFHLIPSVCFAVCMASSSVYVYQSTVNLTTHCKSVAVYCETIFNNGTQLSYCSCVVLIWTLQAMQCKCHSVMVSRSRGGNYCLCTSLLWLLCPGISPVDVNELLFVSLLHYLSYYHPRSR